MKLLPVFLLLCGSVFGQTFTEFYCDYTNGSNLNGGSVSGGGDPEAGVYPITYTGGTWVQATGVFTVAAGNPVTDGVAVGDYASVYADAAAAPTGFVGKVTARDATTITVSLTIAAGTAPTDGTGNRTIKVGGAWKGPDGASGFPFGFVVTALATATDQNPRVNFRNNTSYLPTAGLVADDIGPLRWEGYTTTAGDGGKATFDFSTNAVVYLNTTTGTNNHYLNLIFTGSAASGTNSGITVGSANGIFERIAVSGARGRGFAAASNNTFIECEAYGNNTSATGGYGGFVSSTTRGLFVRCISHDNTGYGFAVGGSAPITTFVDCIADSNTDDGFNLVGAANEPFLLSGCDAYNNGGDGIELANTSTVSFQIQNCNLVKNTGYGINGTGSGARLGTIVNNAFGSGTQANGSGTTTGLKSITESGSITLTADTTPWSAPATGDFRITSSQCKGTGRGTFTQTAPSYSGTVAYPDIGAAQHLGTTCGTRAYGVGR